MRIIWLGRLARSGSGKEAVRRYVGLELSSDQSDPVIVRWGDVGPLPADLTHVQSRGDTLHKFYNHARRRPHS
jgi:hypothetical protein